jgi:hypothetical protein
LVIKGVLDSASTIPGLDGTYQSLLEGELLDFDFGKIAGDFNKFVFLFDVTGGALQPFYPQAVVILTTGDLGFTGSFDGEFSEDDYLPVADTKSTPEPQSLVALIPAIAMGFAYYARRKRGRDSATAT